MAKQKGVMKLIGTLDDFTFLRTTDGFLAKMKTSLTGARIATDPAFIRTRENGAEFGRACKASKLLRNVFRTQMLNARDRSVGTRLTQEMMRVIKSDAVNGRGMRNVQDGEKSILLDFDFNADARLGTTLYALYTTTINRATGEATAQIPPFIPVNEVAAPIGATHYRITAAAAAIDFTASIFERANAASTIKPIDEVLTTPLNLACNLTAGSGLPIFLVLGIEFYQEVNHSNYSLKSGIFNALSIVAVEEAA